MMPSSAPFGIAGTLYGLRVHGRYAPLEGHRFNSAKLLLDPYAKAIVGESHWSDAHFGYTIAQDAHGSARGGAHLANVSQAGEVTAALLAHLTGPPRRRHWP